MDFQIAWSMDTPGEVHVTFSGHMTPCDKEVIAARAKYESFPKDVTCMTCGAYLTFDMTAAARAAREYVEPYAGPQRWDVMEMYKFAHGVADRVAGVAWHVKKEHGSWNPNHVFSEFMAQGGHMTDQSSEARLIGSTALAVLEVLKEAE